MSGVHWWAGRLGAEAAAVRSVGDWPEARRKLHSPKRDGKIMQINITAAATNFGDSLAAAGAASADLERAMLAFTSKMSPLWRNRP